MVGFGSALNDAVYLEQEVSGLGLRLRRLALVDAPQDLAKTASRMSVYLSVQGQDEDPEDYDKVGEEVCREYQGFHCTLQSVFSWTDYNSEVKQEVRTPKLTSVGHTGEFYHTIAR